MSVETPTLKTQSPHAILIDWANDQDHWVRALVAEVIANKQQLADDRIAHYYELLLREKQLNDGDPFTTSPLEPGTTTSEVQEALCLTTLEDVQ